MTSGREEELVEMSQRSPFAFRVRAVARDAQIAECPLRDKRPECSPSLQPPGGLTTTCMHILERPSSSPPPSWAPLPAHRQASSQLMDGSVFKLSPAYQVLDMCSNFNGSLLTDEVPVELVTQGHDMSSCHKRAFPYVTHMPSSRSIRVGHTQPVVCTQKPPQYQESSPHEL